MSDGWISVKWVLPPMMQDVLAFDENGSRVVAYRIAGESRWKRGDGWAIVTHWMPLPKPPEEGE